RQAVKLVDCLGRQIWFVWLKARYFDSDSMSVQRSGNRNGDAGRGSQDENRAWIPTVSHLSAVVGCDRCWLRRRIWVPASWAHTHGKTLLRTTLPARRSL